MFSKKSIKLFLINIWGPALGMACGGLLIIGVLLFRLKSLVPAYSPIETTQLSQAKSLKAIINNP